MLPRVRRVRVALRIEDVQVDVLGLCHGLLLLFERFLLCLFLGSLLLLFLFGLLFFELLLLPLLPFFLLLLPLLLPLELLLFLRFPLLLDFCPLPREICLAVLECNLSQFFDLF